MSSHGKSVFRPTGSKRMPSAWVTRAPEFPKLPQSTETPVTLACARVIKAAALVAEPTEFVNTARKKSPLDAAVAVKVVCVENEQPETYNCQYT